MAGKQANTITIEASQTRLEAGKTIGLTATLKMPATGTVTFTEQPGGWSRKVPLDKHGVAAIPADQHAFHPTPGEHVITATIGGISDKIKLTAIKVKIATPPTLICRRKKSFTIKLTKDSYPGGPVVWTGIPGVTGKGNRFTFSPSKVGEGKYIITAKAIGHGNDKPVRDSVTIMIDHWKTVDQESGTIQYKLDLTSKQIKALGLNNVKISFGKNPKHLNEQIENMIGPNDQKTLRGKWAAAKTGDPFKTWLDKQVEQAAKRVIQKLDSCIKQANAFYSPQIDLLANSVATMASKDLSQPLEIEASYCYKCGGFNHGQPGWTQPNLASPAFQSVKGDFSLGFNTNVPIELAGVKIGDLPLKAKATITLEIKINGIKTSTPIWLPSPDRPKATTQLEPIVTYTISGKTSEQAPATVDIKGMTSFKLDSKAYPLKLKAKHDESMTLPYAP